jgi:LysR family nitrogen assimilation transcriptional regulator
MDLRQLEYFLRVAELGSFSRAAGVLGIAQPALSRQVRQLEVEFRQTLLHRNGRGASPTEAGRRLLEHARGLLEQAERTRRAMAERDGMLSGRVSIGLPPTLSGVHTVRLVRAFRERYPQASIVIVEGLTATLQEWLATGRIDIGALYNPVPAPAIELLPWAEERLYLIARIEGAGRRGAPQKRSAKPDPLPATVTLAALADTPLVIPSRPNAFRMLLESRLAQIGRKANVALEVDGVAAILDLVAEGYGAALLPREALQIARQPELLHARPIVKPELAIPLALAVSSYRARTPLQNAVIALAHEVRRETSAGERGQNRAA